MKAIKILSRFLCGFCLLLTAVPAFAAADDHWETEHTYVNFYALIGKIGGLTNLAKGDEVAAFDSQGNCYGKGIVRDADKNYALSLYPAEEGGVEIDGIAVPDDFAIPGFAVGDEAIFRVYVKVEDREYTLEPVDGGTYRFNPQANEHGFPPNTLNLVYRAPDEPPPPDDEPPAPKPKDETKSRIISGGLPYVTPTAKPKTPPKPTVPAVTGKEILQEEPIGIPGIGGITQPDYYPTPPVPAGQRRVSSVPEPERKPAARADYSKLEPYEPEITKKRPPRVAEVEIEPVKGWPLWLRILLFLLFLALLVLSVRKLMQMQEEDSREDPPRISKPR